MKEHKGLELSIGSPQSVVPRDQIDQIDQIPANGSENLAETGALASRPCTIVINDDQLAAERVMLVESRAVRVLKQKLRFVRDCARQLRQTSRDPMEDPNVEQSPQMKEA